MASREGCDRAAALARGARWALPLLLLSSCQVVFGLDDYKPLPEAGGGGAGAGGAGGGTTTSTTSTTGSDGGGGGAPKKDLGETCGGGDECASSFCADGICCSQACDEECKECTGAGICGSLPDMDSCGGATGTCMGGVCMKHTGQACTGEDCLSGFCTDNVCCDTLCLNDCTSCDQVTLEGTCSPDPVGDPGNCSGGKVCNAAGLCG